MLGISICLLYFGCLLGIASLLLIYGTFKRRSKLLIPYLVALFDTVSLIILLKVLPEYILYFNVLFIGALLLLIILIGELREPVDLMELRFGKLVKLKRSFE
jgi:hypothetical protein